MDILKQLEEGKPFSGRNGAFTGRVEPQSIEGDTLKVICDISKCHASCCYNAPLPKKYIFALKNRIVNPVKEILVIDDENMKGEVMCYPITDHNPDKNKCPFLTENCRCNIYDRRPPICKKFGNGTEPLLTCSFLVPEEQRESVLAGYKSAINKLTSPTAWELAKKYK